MNHKALLLRLILLSSVSTLTFAEGIEITPAVGYRMGGIYYDDFTRQEIDVEDDSSEGITLGFVLDEDVTLEASWSRQKTKFDFHGSLPPLLDSNELDIEYWHVGVMMRPSAGFWQLDASAGLIFAF